MAMIARTTSQCSVRSAAHRQALPRPSARPSVQCRDAFTVVSTIAAAGDVEAPAWIPLAVAGVVTVVGTAIIPLALNPGQKAADKIFQAKENKPLDKVTIKAPAKGKKK